MIRLFAALALPDDIAAGLALRQDKLEGAKWRRRDQLHLTLRFFGEIREDLARDLDAELLEVAVPPFDIQLKGVGAFGEGPDLHAVWAGVGESEPLRRLAKACEVAARRVGLAPDTRRYTPHVTLAYLNRPDRAAVAAWLETHGLLSSPWFTVTRFGVYSSFLGGEGAHYRLEADYPLA